jgi:DNA-binding MarR family transcriptional regulator
MSKYENLKLDKQLCFALYTATNSITRVYRRLLADYDLTYPQYLVLLVLWDKDGVAIKDVMNSLILDSGTLSPIIKRLQASGLVNKVRADKDERIVRLYLTDESKKLEKNIAAVQESVANDTQLCGEEFLDLINQLNVLSDNLNTSIETLKNA